VENGEDVFIQPIASSLLSRFASKEQKLEKFVHVILVNYLISKRFAFHYSF
jgi:hypothetical protein